MNKIFISYSSKDREWVSDWLLPRLESKGIQVIIDYRDFEIGRPSIINIEEAVKSCDNTFLILTPNWIESEWTNLEALMIQTDDPIGLRGKFIPLMLKQCKLPRPLGIFTYANFKEKNNWDTEMSRLLEQLGIKVPGDKIGPVGPYLPLKSEKISTYKLPSTGELLFGRDRELKVLDEAWNDGEIDVVTLVAWGGVGKTALVNHWLNTMRKENYKGAQKVYAWSFYSQGVEEGKQTSADEFMQETLKWFGDDDPAKGSTVEKGRRLARLVKKERTLLILDGMEPLQYPPGQVHGLDGKLKDQCMRAFLRELSGGFNGLCIITSREKVTDLADKKYFTVTEMELEHLSIDAGAELLKGLGVKGSDKDILKAAEEYDGHALALTLLGQYIRSAYNGDIRKRDRIPHLTKERIQGGHARRVMEAYEKWLGESAEKYILYMMGLFDRPAEVGAIEALKAEPAIPGVTDQLLQLSGEDWNRALFNLRAANLLAAENPQKQDVLDCHPLIREHFGEKLKEKNVRGWKESHKRLYYYFKELPKKELPDTLQEMEPLFAAVAHGCKAGFFKEALDDVYWRRIQRGSEAYTIKKLGAFGSDLAALSNFFEVTWNKPANELPDDCKAVILNWVAFRLRAIGRLPEALQPIKAALEMRIKQEAWENAARNTANFSELMLTLGEVSQAVDYARQSVTHADRSGDAFLREISRTTLADALHRAGLLEEAEKWFREAEAKQKERQPEIRYLYSLRGFQFCDLLLGQGKYIEVIERAEKTLEWAIQQRKSILDIALNELILGRAWMMQAVSAGSDDYRRAMEYLDHAVVRLREAGQQDYLTNGLLARAECYRMQEKFTNAREDLEEANEIAALGAMKIFLADSHLESVRLCNLEGKAEESINHFKTASNMIHETGYYLKDKELADLSTIFKEKELPRLGPTKFLSKDDLERVIYDSILDYGQTSINDLSDIFADKKSAALANFPILHSELDLVYEKESEKLFFKNLKFINDFQEFWKKARDGNNDTFLSNVPKVIHSLRNSLKFPLTKNKIRYDKGKIFAQFINIKPISRELRIRSEIPIVFLQSNKLSEDDLESLKGIIKSNLKYSDRVVIIVLFGDSKQISNATNLVNQKIFKVYRNVFIIFDYRTLMSIICSKEPIQILQNIMLSKIDLRTVSPFISTGPTPDNMFFGREKEIWEIIEHAKKTSFALIGGRKFGKTSILRQLERIRLKDADFNPYYYTCEHLKVAPSKSEFLEGVAKSWLQKMPTEDINRFNDLLEYLPKDKPLAFLIDEVDRLIEPDRKSGWPLFGELRALAQEGRCQFLFTGERELRRAVIEDTEGRLFNFTETQKIGCLNFDNVKELVCKPMKEMNIDLVNKESIVKGIWDFTKGHPSIVQKMCQNLIDHLDHERKRSINMKDLKRIINDPKFQYNDFLLVFWQHATILERIITLIIPKSDKYYNFMDIVKLFKDKFDLVPQKENISEALKRLVELRSILTNTPDGYKFFVDSFPNIISNSPIADEILVVLVEKYKEHGDIIPL